MARAATGEVIVHERRSGRIFALRFRAYGKRRYLTLGSAEEGWTRQIAEGASERPRRRQTRDLEAS